VPPHEGDNVSNKKPQHHHFRGFLDIVSEMNRMQHQWMLRSDEAGGQDREHATAWVPTTDIFAKGKDLIIRCELPGMRREDVEVTVHSGVLTITGERRSDLGVGAVTFHTRERVSGVFRRSMILPEGFDQSHIKATVQNGLLEIVVQGAAGANVQRVKVEEGE